MLSVIWVSERERNSRRRRLYRQIASEDTTEDAVHQSHSTHTDNSRRSHTHAQHDETPKHTRRRMHSLNRHNNHEETPKYTRKRIACDMSAVRQNTVMFCWTESRNLTTSYHAHPYASIHLNQSLHAALRGFPTGNLQSRPIHNPSEL